MSPAFGVGLGRSFIIGVPVGTVSVGEEVYLVTEAGEFIVTEAGEYIVTETQTVVLATEDGKYLVTEAGEWIVNA